MEKNVEFVVDEISKIIKDNLLLMYRFSDNTLANLKKCCEKKKNDEYTSNEELLILVREAMRELLKSEFLYDFRDIE